MADDNLQKMYEYQELKGNSNSEYVVRGAEVSCPYGSQTCVLNLQNDHGVCTTDNRPLITVNDSKITNISGFGNCNKNRYQLCKCTPDLGKWSIENKDDMKIFDFNTHKEEYAVEKNAITFCQKGGVVSFKTSGQTAPRLRDRKSVV